MRISKSTKTSVKASSNTSDYKQCLKDALVAKGGYSKSDVADQSTATLESWAKDAGIDINNVCACGDVKASTEPNTPDVNKSKLVRQIIKQAKEIRDYFQSHNNNLNRTQEQYLEDLSDGIDNESVMTIREAVEGLKYNSKNLRKEQYYLVEDLYDEFNLANGKFEGMGRPGSDDVDACGDIKASTSTDKALQHIKAAIDILGKSGDKDAVTKDSIANLGVVMLDLKSNK